MKQKNTNQFTALHELFSEIRFGLFRGLLWLVAYLLISGKRVIIPQPIQPVNITYT